MLRLLSLLSYTTVVFAQTPLPFSFFKPAPQPPAFVNLTSSTACGTTMTLTKPTGLAVGDLMIVIIGIDSTSSLATPAGWTKQQAQTGGGYGNTLFTKVADAADVAAANFSFTKPASTCDNLGVLAAYTKVAASPVQFTSKNLNTTTSCTHTGGTATQAPSMFFTYCSSYSNPNTPAGFTSRLTGTWAARVSEKVISATGATGDFTSTGASTMWVTLSVLIAGQ